MTAGTAAINAGFGAEGDPTQDMIANVAFMLLMEVLHIAVPKAKELIFPKIKEAIQATPPEQLKKDLDILTNNLTPEQITDL